MVFLTVDHFKLTLNGRALRSLLESSEEKRRGTLAANSSSRSSAPCTVFLYVPPERHKRTGNAYVFGEIRDLGGLSNTCHRTVRRHDGKKKSVTEDLFPSSVLRPRSLFCFLQYPHFAFVKGFVWPYP